MVHLIEFLKDPNDAREFVIALSFLNVCTFRGNVSNLVNLVKYIHVRITLFMHNKLLWKLTTNKDWNGSGSDCLVVASFWDFLLYNLAFLMKSQLVLHNFKLSSRRHK